MESKVNKFKIVVLGEGILFYIILPYYQILKANYHSKSGKDLSNSEICARNLWW